MTFTEAALEVLRTAGEPLHYKKITELAIERNLLSHVGKTPEVTMSSRLAMMVKKDRGQAPIMKVKPGVFAIRESALQGQSLSPAALAAISEIEGLDESVATAPADAAPTGTEEPVKAPQLPGADVFPEEEGDDDPILAGLEQESEGGERGGRRRRRRRRRGKGDKAEAQPEVSVRPEAPRESGRERQRESFRDRPRHERFERQDRSERQDRPERQDRAERSERQERNNGRHGGHGGHAGHAARSSEERVEERSEDTSLDWNRQPGDGDLLGKDLADAVWSVLSRGDRAPHSFSRVAELLVRRGRLSGAPAALAPTIAAAVRADIARAELQRGRPRFRLRAGRLSLAEWQLPKSLSRAEQDMLSSAERYASEVRRALIQKLSELPTAGFAELLATWLNAEGVTALRAVRRPGSSGSELHFAGTRKTGSEELRLAIVVQRNGRDIDREAVIDVRGALHHYGQAQAAWVVTLGRITSGAREEAGAQASACALFDGNALAAAMERLGIAMRRNVIAHHEIDYDLLEALGDSPEQRERREREQQREQRQRQSSERSQRARSGRNQGESLPPPAAGTEEEESVELESEEVEALVTRKTLRDADWDEDDVHEVVAPAGDEAEEEEEGDSAREDDDEEHCDDEATSSSDDAEPESFHDELEESQQDDDGEDDDDSDEDESDDYEASARNESDDGEEDSDDAGEEEEADDSDDSDDDDSDESEDDAEGSSEEEPAEERDQGRRRERG